ncbi:MAG: tetratricopeptide repeat protein [Promethearchaeota archaeon]
MSDLELLEEYKGAFTDLIKSGKGYTYLVGAGISMDPPSSIPSAREIVRAMLELCAPMEEIDNLLSLRTLRYEMMIEKIKNTVDKDLHFLDYLELIDQPNYIHYYLANAVVKRHDYVVTTNFDFMIERALQNVIRAEKQNDILPVITREDFNTKYRPHDLFNEEKYPLYKIHGSKRDIITGKDTKESLITTMGALGKDREVQETFALETYKKQAVYNLMKDQTLIVMGYSGSDDFDIGPTLKTITYLDKLIWIEHSQDEKILKINKNLSGKKLESFSHSEQLLIEIATQADFDVYIIRINTSKFAKEILWQLLLSEISIPAIDITTKKEIPEFKGWVQDEFKDVNITEVRKYMISCSIYNELSLSNECYLNAEKGLELAKLAQDIDSQTFFLNYLGSNKLKKGELEEAENYFKESLKLSEELENPLKKAIALSNLGQLIMRKNELRLDFNPKEALETMLEALTLFDKQRDSIGKLACLNNIAEAYLWEGSYEQALQDLMTALTLVMDIGNLEIKATISNNVGWITSRILLEDSLKVSMEKFNDASNIREQMGDLSGLANCLRNIGDLNFNFYNYDQAYDYYTKELELRISLGDIKAEAMALLSIGWVYYRQGNLSKASNSFQKALEINRKLNDNLYIAYNTSSLGYITYLQGELNTSIDFFRESLQIYSDLKIKAKLKEIETYIDVLELIIKSLRTSKDQKDMLIDLLPLVVKDIEDIGEQQKVLETEVCKKKSPMDMLNQSLYFIYDGILYALRDDIQKAKEKIEGGLYSAYISGNMEDVFPLFKGIIDSGLLIRPLNLERTRFDYVYRDDNILSPEEAEWLHSSYSRNRLTVAHNLFEEAYMDSQIGNTQSAIEKFEEAREIYEEFDEIEFINTIDNYVTTIKMISGELDDSDESLNQQLFKQVKSTIDIGNKQATEEDLVGLKHNIKVASQMKDRLENLRHQDDTYNQLYNMLGDFIYNNEAKVADVDEEDISYKGTHEFTKVADDLVRQEASRKDKARELFESIGVDDKNAGIDLTNMGTIIDDREKFIHEHSEDWLLTLNKLTVMANLDGSMGKINEKVETMIFIGKYFQSANELEAALSKYEECLKNAQTIGNQELQAKSLTRIGNVLFFQGKYEESLDNYEKSLRIFEEIKKEEERIEPLNFIGQIYAQRGDLERAFKRLNEAIEIDATDKEIIAHKADSFARLGELYKKQNNFLEAYDNFSLALKIYEELDEKEQMRAPLHYHLALLDKSINDVEMALINFEEALSIYQEINFLDYVPKIQEEINILKTRLSNPETKGEDKAKLAFNCAKLYLYDDALVASNQAIEIFTSLGKLPEKAQILQLSGEINDALGEIEEAKYLLNEALIIYNQIVNNDKIEQIKGFLDKINGLMADPEYMIEYLNKKAQSLLNEGKESEALLKYHYLLNFYDQVEDLLGKATCLRSIADIHYNRQEKTEALENYLACIEIFEKINKDTETITPLTNAGYIYEQLFKYEKSLECHQKVLSITRKANNLFGSGVALTEIARILQIQQKLDKALDLYKESLEIFEEMKNDNNIAYILSRLGVIYDTQGKFNDALDVLEQSRALYEELDNKLALGGVYNSLANIYESLGKLDDALTNYNNALKNSEEVNDVAGKAALLFNIGLIYKSKEEYTTALEHYDEAMAIAEELNIPQYKAPFFMGMGEIDKKLGHLDTALEKFNKSLEIYELIGDSEGIIESFNSIGKIFLKKGNLNSAEESLKKAFKLAENIDSIKKKAYCRSAIGDLYRYQNEIQKALDMYQEALNIFEQLEMKDPIASTLRKIGKGYFKLGNKTKYKECMQKASDLYAEIGLEKKVKHIQQELNSNS